MILKKFSALSSVLVLVLASLFSLAFSGQAQAVGTTLYWCEFASNSNWNTASNWNTSSACSGGTQEVPVSGDSLVFNNSSLTSTLDLTNDIAGLDISSITFMGTGTGTYNLSGDAISLDNGITDTVSTLLNDVVSMSLTLTSSQTFNNNQAGDNLYIDGSVNLGSNNLTLATKANQLVVANSLTGSGTLTLASPPSGSTTAYYTFDNPSTSFTGPVVIDAGAIAKDNSNNLTAFGSGLITVNNGGVLDLLSSNANGTLTNPLNLNGSGVAGTGLYAITSCLSDSPSCTSTNTTLTLSGKVTLAGNTVLVNGAYLVGESSPPANNAKFDFTGSGIYNGYTLTSLNSSNTTVNDPVAISSTSSTSSTSSSSNPPKAPNTGEGLIATNDYLPIIGGSLIAATLILISVVLSRRLSNFSSSKK